ncbi:acetate/propionate family kinase [Kocuria sp. M1R5S2]|uniref:acetate/propionate family kinase n=1 Tax=Kocuria rhizosphaerae TaxID=3376285 RepID=UPI0037927DDA
MLVLVVNCGSSSLKYQVRELEPGAEGGTVLASGLIENIGGAAVRDHTQALELLAQRLEDELDGRTIDAAGHRVVHGGERFSVPALVDDGTIDAIEELSPLAPLHNPAAVLGLRAVLQKWPELPQVCVFDTAFHGTMPEHVWRYAVPEEFYERWGIRRYGFHGTSHDWVTGQAARFLGIPRPEFSCVVAHLGNGASVTAVRHGSSYDTSMGYTPLAGLVMGTRTGDLDPSVVTSLLRRDPAATPEGLDAVLNKESGLKAIAGDHDMRAVQEAADRGDERAELALAMAAYRLAKYVGGYHVAVDGAQALVFTAGIGENAVAFRKRVCDRLGALGVVLDDDANAARSRGIRRISAPESAIEVLVVPTDEEQAIASATAALVAAGSAGAPS